MNELAKRAVACKGWRLMPGMLCVPVGGGFPVRYRGVICRDMPDAGGVRYLPDLTDPATLGCLLALVRAAWGDSGVSVWRDRRCGLWSWMAEARNIAGLGPYASEAEALLAALEAASDDP